MDLDTLSIIEGTTATATLGPTRHPPGAPPGAQLAVREGPIYMFRADNKFRVRLLTGDELSNKDGGMLLLDKQGDTGVGPAGASSAISLSAADRALVIRDKDGRERVVLGPQGNLVLGGGDTEGDVILRDQTGRERVRLSAAAPRLATFAADGRQLAELDGSGNLMLGGTNADSATVFLDSVNGNLKLGGNKVRGDVLVRDADSHDRIHLDAGGNGATSRTRIHLDGSNATLTLGGDNSDGDIRLKDKDGKEQIHIDGEAGDITLSNADCAEDFDLAGDEALELDPGTVMALATDGRLRESDRAYDRTVAGVLSGAGAFRPAMVLDRRPGSTRRRPLALVGKVYCKVDADHGAIVVGDLLTTSTTRGHAMKADDPGRAFGAVIGKALQPLASGRGLIPILVALQ